MPNLFKNTSWDVHGFRPLNPSILEQFHVGPWYPGLDIVFRTLVSRDGHVEKLPAQTVFNLPVVKYNSDLLDLGIDHTAIVLHITSTRVQCFKMFNFKMWIYQPVPYSKV